MNSIVFIESQDEGFAEILCRTLISHGIPAQCGEDGKGILASLAEQAIDVVLLDVRQQYEKVLAVLRSIKDGFPEVEVLIINRPYNIWIAVEGMRAGASDEITVPLDTDILRAKVTEARLRAGKLRKKKKKSLLQRFSNAMSAATFAQAGDFDTALEMLNDGGTGTEKDAGKT